MEQDRCLEIAFKLAKSGLPSKEIKELIAPQFQGDNKALNALVETAVESAADGSRVLAQEIREYVMSTTGDIWSKEVDREFNLSTRVDKQNRWVIMKRLVEEGLIVPDGKRSGCFRIPRKDFIKMKLVTPGPGEKIILPLGLHKLVKLYPSSIAVIAGTRNAGKTAFCLNVLADNLGLYKIHYFNSESGEEEFADRLRHFDDMPIEDFYKAADLRECSSDFADVIVPGKGHLNIIDFMEIHEEHYKVGSWIKAIHDRLSGALCVIALQKPMGRDAGVGGEFSLEKPRLYLSMERNSIKITKAKIWKDPYKNPNGMTIQFKLINGCKFIPQDVWSFKEE